MDNPVPSGPREPLTLQLLGTFAVQVGGREVPQAAFRRPRARQLLKLLALEPGHRLHREQVLERLWPNLAPNAAAAQLYKAVHQVRRALGTAAGAIPPEHLLVVRGESLFLTAPGGVSTDVETFEALSERALHTGAGPDLERACAVWHGELLPDDPYEEWTLAPREQLSERWCALLLARGEAALAGGQLPEAEAAFAAVLAHDPTREAAHRGLMRLHAARGDRAALERQYQRVVAALADAFGSPPHAETVRLHGELLQATAGDAARATPLSSPPAPGRHNLPPPATPFVGRVDELARITGRLDDPACRLLVLTGPGGVGKTRLALQAAAERLEAFADGVWLVRLERAATSGGLAAEIADALGLAAPGGPDPLGQVLAYLRGREGLLILDSFEHLLEGPDADALRGWLGALLGQSRVKLLVTSREAPHLPGEWCLEVAGLEVPPGDDAEHAEGFSAVRLFLQSARRFEPGFSPTAPQRAEVAGICRRLDGFPLALELAASWVRVLSLDEIARELERGLDFLGGAPHGLPARHASLRAVLEPTWRLLTPGEREVFARLSVFRGGFRRAAAEAVAGATLPVLARLADRSLVRRDSTGRFHMHELLRQFAGERLAESALAQSRVRHRHAAFFAQWVRQREARLRGAGQAEALRDFREELGNVRAAWAWAGSQGRLVDFAAASEGLCLFYEEQGWLEEGLRTFADGAGRLRALGWRLDGTDTAHSLILARLHAGQGRLAAVLDRGEEARELLGAALGVFARTGARRDEAVTRARLGFVASHQGDFAQAREHLGAAIALARELGDDHTLAQALGFLGEVYGRSGGDLAQQRAILEESLAISTRTGDLVGMADALGNLGNTVQALGQFEEARALQLRALDVYRHLGSRVAEAVLLINLGLACLNAGRFEEAESHLRDALALAEPLGHRNAVAHAHTYLGRVAHETRRPAEAASHYHTALELYRGSGERYFEAYVLAHLGDVTRALGDGARAWAYLQGALRQAQVAGTASVATRALLFMATWLADAGESARALELAAFTAGHPAAPRLVRGAAEALTARLTCQLDPGEAETVLERARTRTFDDLTAQLLPAPA